MKKLSLILLVTLGLSLPAIAENKLSGEDPIAFIKPNDVLTIENSSEVSIRKLLEITNTKSLLENSIAEVDGMLENSMKEVFSNQELSPEKQKMIHAAQKEMTALVKNELNWKTVEAMAIDIYAKTFSQEEINSMLAFYTSTEGQAIIKKMPVVMQLTMQNLQNMTSNLVKKLNDLQEEIMDKLDTIE